MTIYKTIYVADIISLLQSYIQLYVFSRTNKDMTSLWKAIG